MTENKEMNNEEAKVTLQQQERNLKQQMPVKRLQVELQELNTRFVELKVREMEAIHKLQQFEAGQLEAKAQQEQYIKDNIVEHTISQEDIDMNPELVEAGIVVGQTIGIPKEIYKDVKLANKKEFPDAQDNTPPVKDETIAAERKLKVVED